MNKTWLYILAGTALVVGGVTLLLQLPAMTEAGEDPIAEAQKMLSRAQTKVSEIESGIRDSHSFSSQPA